MSHAGPRESVVVGVPIDSYGKPGGTELAPATLRELGIVEALGARDAGDLDVRIVGTERDEASGIMGYPSVVETSRGIRDGLGPLLREDAFLVVLGGCCTLVPGVAAALRLAAQRAARPRVHRRPPRHVRRQDESDRRGRRHAGRDRGGVGDRALIELGTVTPLVAPSHIAFLGHRDSDEAQTYGALLARRARRRHLTRCRERATRRPGSAGLPGRARAASARGALLALDRCRRAVGSRLRGNPRTAGRRLTADELIALARPLPLIRVSRHRPSSATTSTWTTTSAPRGGGWSRSCGGSSPSGVDGPRRASSR